MINNLAGSVPVLMYEFHVLAMNCIPLLSVTLLTSNFYFSWIIGFFFTYIEVIS